MVIESFCKFFTASGNKKYVMVFLGCHLGADYTIESAIFPIPDKDKKQKGEPFKAQKLPPYVTNRIDSLISISYGPENGDTFLVSQTNNFYDYAEVLVFNFDGSKLDVTRTDYNIQGVQKHQFIPSYGEKEAVYLAFVNFANFGLKVVKIYGEGKSMGVVRYIEIPENSSRISDIVCHEYSCAVKTDSSTIFYLDFKTEENTNENKMLVLSEHKVWTLPSHTHILDIDVTQGMVAYSSPRTE